MSGVAMLARTTDKAKAKAHGNLGEYHYNCPMDAGVFAFLGIDHEEFLKEVANAKDDGAIEAYAKTFADKKTPQEIEQFNAGVLASKPEPGSESEAYFLDLRNAVAPDRTDVTTWPDLIDLDEKRNVPKRADAVAR
ncbi:MAG: DUF5069 domain-containing protein [Candidatus Eremiobacteraeota bacterium]|nr:DUF5069 domain-containing protein [Candidatus Eremiobacteraeota bacterium]